MIPGLNLLALLMALMLGFRGASTGVIAILCDTGVCCPVECDAHDSVADCPDKADGDCCGMAEWGKPLPAQTAKAQDLSPYLPILTALPATLPEAELAVLAILSWAPAQDRAPPGPAVAAHFSRGPPGPSV